jgi:hypothetical protein
MRRPLFLGYVDNKSLTRDFDAPARLWGSRAVRARLAVRMP